MTLLRLSVLALLVNALTIDAVVLRLAEAQACASPVGACDCCETEAAPATRGTDPSAELPSIGYGFIGDRAPVTEAHVRLPFRPPTAT